MLVEKITDSGMTAEIKKCEPDYEGENYYYAIRVQHVMDGGYAETIEDAREVARALIQNEINERKREKPVRKEYHEENIFEIDGKYVVGYRDGIRLRYAMNAQERKLTGCSMGIYVPKKGIYSTLASARAAAIRQWGYSKFGGEY